MKDSLSRSLNDSAEVIRHGLDMAEIFLIKNAHALNAPPVLSAIKEAQAVIAVMGDVNDTNVVSKTDTLSDCTDDFDKWCTSVKDCGHEVQPSSATARQRKLGWDAAWGLAWQDGRKAGLRDAEILNQREIRLITEEEIIDSLTKHAKYLHAPITGNERGLIRDIVSLCGAGLIEADKFLKRELVDQDLQDAMRFAYEWIQGLPTFGDIGRTKDKRAALKVLEPTYIRITKIEGQ